MVGPDVEEKGEDTVNSRKVGIGAVDCLHYKNIDRPIFKDAPQLEH